MKYGKKLQAEVNMTIILSTLWQFIKFAILTFSAITAVKLICYLQQGQ